MCRSGVSMRYAYASFQSPCRACTFHRSDVPLQRYDRRQEWAMRRRAMVQERVRRGGGETGSAFEEPVEWAAFIQRHQPAILRVIARRVQDPDDRMDVFAVVCEALSADDCRRLRRYNRTSWCRAKFATWLAAVVRNLTIDWLRARDGRPQRSVPPHLSPLHQAIYQAVCLDGQPYAAAYEAIRARMESAMTYPRFLRQVRELNRIERARGEWGSGCVSAFR